MKTTRKCTKRNIRFQHVIVASILLSSFSPSLLLAQELPKYNTSKFDYSVSYRTNVCSRSALLQNDAMDDWKDALIGLELSAAVHFGPQHETLYNFDDEGRLSRDYPGLIAVIMDMVAKRAGFTWRDNFGTFTSIDATDENKTWTDLLEWSVEVYDISATYWSKSINRLNRGIAFPHGWYDGSLVLVQKGEKEKGNFSLCSFARPFDPWVWMLILASTFATAAMYWLLEWLDNDRADALNLRQSPLHAIFLAAIGFTQHFEFRPNTGAAMLLSWSWSFWSLIIAACYTANLASHLVTQYKSVRTFDDLDHAVKSGAEVCVLRSANMDEYVTKKFPTAPNIQRYGTARETFQALEKGKCSAVLASASTLDQFERDITLNSDCTLKTFGRAEVIVPSGFATKVDSHGPYCTSLISHVLDLHLLEMEANGDIGRAWDAYLTNMFGQDTCGQSSPDSTDESTHEKMDMEDMGGIFALHYTLCAIALSYAWLVWLKKWCLTRKRKVGGNENDYALNGPLSRETITIIRGEQTVKTNKDKEHGDERGVWVKGWFSKNRLQRGQTVEMNENDDAFTEPLLRTTS